MFLCAYFNLRVSSLRAFFMKKMMDAISSVTACSFQVLSTEIVQTSGENGMKRDFSVALESGKVVKDSHPSLVRYTMAPGSSISCVAPGWRTKSLLRVILHF